MINKIMLSAGFDPENRFAMLTPQFARALRAFDAGMKELIHPGVGDDAPLALFWQTVASIAGSYNSLSLPQSDEDRGGPETTRYFQFAALMRELVLEHATEILPATGDGGRLTRLRTLSRANLIRQLRTAREAISR